MSDPSFQLTTGAFNDITGPTLWVVDENISEAFEHVAPHPQLSVITNRYDIWANATAKGFSVTLCDYDFTAFNSSMFHRVVYRISKERPVVHHVINESWRVLAPHGTLWLAGEKSEGIKGFIDKAGKLLQNRQSAEKHGTAYRAILTKNCDFDTAAELDTKQYSQQRTVATIEVDNHPLTIRSKPGVYGWQKLDQGSQLLMDTVEAHFLHHPYPKSLLDLGCGYGYLTLRTRHWGCQTRFATDNNVAAINCARTNIDRANMKVHISVDDCGSKLSTPVEAILCNPPFHKGFQTSSELTRLFLQQSARLLQPAGTAFFVVNHFIALEKLATHYFKELTVLHSDKHFKVIALRQSFKGSLA